MVTMLIKDFYINMEKIKILRSMSVDNKTTTNSNRKYYA